MNRTVYMLLAIGVLSPVLNAAHAETMAERKQRIMRKYLRERQTIVQGDLVVPDSALDDARVAESEQFREPQVNFQRQEGSTMPRPAPRPAPVQAEEQSWWLQAAALDEDPFASNTDDSEPSSDAWSAWKSREDSAANAGSSDTQRDYWGRGESFLGRGSAYDMQQGFDNGSPVSSLTYGTYTSRWSSAGQGTDRMSGRYGSQQPETRETRSGWGLNPVTSYGSSPSSGLLQSPFSMRSSTQSGDTQNQSPGYTPYSNPFQNQRDDQRIDGGNLQPQHSDYSRPQPYEKWKDNNKKWDPTADDSYLDALMRDKRR